MVCPITSGDHNYITLSNDRPGRGPTQTELAEIAQTCLRPALGQVPLYYPGRRPGRRAGFRHVADRVELSRHVEISRTWLQIGSGHIPLCYPARELVTS